MNMGAVKRYGGREPVELAMSTIRVVDSLNVLKVPYQLLEIIIARDNTLPLFTRRIVSVMLGTWRLQCAHVFIFVADIVVAIGNYGR